MVIIKKTIMTLQHSSVARLYHTYRRVSGGGADGRVMGVNGSINPLAFFSMLMAMKVGGRTAPNLLAPPLGAQGALMKNWGTLISNRKGLTLPSHGIAGTPYAPYRAR
jgi:hypothetical protein